MSRYCPIVDHKVTYQFCEDCEDHKCREKDKDKEEDKEEDKDKKSLSCLVCPD